MTGHERTKEVPTSYVFDLSESGGTTIQLTLTRDPSPPHRWKATNDKKPCLTVAGGTVDYSKPTQLICDTGPVNHEPVMTLSGASWDSVVGDSGEANCDGCDPGCNTQWQWKLTKKN